MEFSSLDFEKDRAFFVSNDGLSATVLCSDWIERLSVANGILQTQWQYHFGYDYKSLIPLDNGVVLGQGNSSLYLLEEDDKGMPKMRNITLEANTKLGTRILSKDGKMLCLSYGG